MGFRLWFEMNQLQLPPIPPGLLRLTHFTSPNIAQMILAGSDFSFQKQGMLSSTADAFSTNDDVLQLIDSGRVGAFTRDSFGPMVVLMDMTNDEYRMLSMPTTPTTSVPNDRVLGVVDRKTMQFSPNARYNPSPVPIQRPTPMEKRPIQFGTPVPIPSPSTAASSDVW